MRGSLVALTLVALTATALADKATLVALAPATDARKAVAIGPAGEVYAPDGKGAWIRTQAGGTAVELVGATLGGGTIVAAAKAAPPFKLRRGSWSALHLVPRAKAIIGAGTRALAAVGNRVFAIDKATPRKLADAPGPVTSLAASARGAVIVTDGGLHRLVGAAWKPIVKAPKAVIALVSDRWALVDKGALDLETLEIVRWPAGLRIAEATTVGDVLVVVATQGKQRELVRITGRELERESIPIATTAPVVGLVVDRSDRVVVAARDGTLAMREAGTWTTTHVRVDLAAPRPGPAPAASP